MNHSRIDKKNLEDVLGLTAMQEGMLFHYLTDPGSKQYFEQMHLRLTGNLDIGLFKKAWQTVVRSNEMLRSIIRWEKLDEPVQIVLKEKEILFQVHDLSGEPREEQPGLLAQIREADKNQIIDLANNPLRLALCILNHHEAEMVITFHHIIYDGWSNGIILKEFLNIYNDLCHGKKPRIYRKTKYKEFYRWYQALAKDSGQDELWKRYLEGFDTRTLLPYDKGKIGDITHVKTHKITLLPDFKNQVNTLLQNNNITLAVLMFTTWGLLLQRYNNSHDVIFGVTISGRTPMIAGIEDVVGLFINTLPLRFKLETPGEDTTANLFHRIGEHLKELGARGYEHTPLTRIRKFAAIGKENDLFDSLVVIDNYPLEGIAPGMNISIQSFDQFEMTNFDLTLQIMPSGLQSTIDICFHYNELLFKPGTIQRLAEHFHNILSGITASSSGDKKVAALRMISQKEQEQILLAFNNPDIQYLGDKTIHGIIHDQAQKTPDRIAIVKTQHITYREFDREADKLAGRLQESGVIVGSRIAILLPRSIRMIVSVLGILKSGGACIPLDITYPEERSNFIIEDSGAKVLIDEKFFRESVPAGAVLQKSSPGDLAYIIYTSGSTGKPKGALLNHWGIVNHTYTKMGVLGITENDIVGNNFSINVIASVWQILSPLFTGAKLVLYSDEVEWDPYLQFQRVACDGVTVIEVIPPVLKTYLFLLDEGKTRVNLDGLRKIALTSEETKPFLVNKFYEKYHGTQLVDCYGQTECSDDVLHYSIPACTNTEKVPIGTPSLNTQVLILSRNNQLQPIGVIGEICVSGAGVAEGYWNRPEMNQEKFVINPLNPGIRMYRTGDLGCWMPDGKVEYLGRIDHQVKIRGNRVELREIENNVMGFEAVKEVAVIAREDKEGEKNLYAFFEADREITTSEIRQYLLKTLPDYMVPAYFVKMENLPHTPNGKIDRKALARLEVKTSLRTGTEYKPPRSEFEHKIEIIWRELLDKEKIGVNDNFFDLGGHSLLLIKLKSKLEKTFAREITIVDLFNYPTIDRQASYFEGNGNGQGEREEKEVKRKPKQTIDGHSCPVAVIGTALRIPGAGCIDEFWKNISSGIESITFFSDEELEGSRVYTYIQGQARRVAAGGVLGDIDLFDADFFGFTPREAEIIDPQQRLFLEYAWIAMENAGYAGDLYPGIVGVYAGTGWNTYLMNNVLLNPGLIRHVGEFQTMIGNDKDFLPTRVSYKLNLKGPSVTIQTACSTSLVALHHAKQSLVNYECDIAMAGGVAIKVPERTGYFYNEGGHLSPDGHCRAFDANAKGTVFGNGLGIVVLKRLADAQADNDHIYAVIKGSAINNDGSLKVGYASPSETGQADVVFAALKEADIDPRTIGYVETHGTGTLLGDPVEITALSRAYREYYSYRNNGNAVLEKQYCAVGSVKANIGHLDAAAGIIGFIKAVLCLYRQQMPPSINVSEPNRIIDFPNTPFYVNRTLRDWPAGQTPRRAAASSLGIGGTNAHVVLEEYTPGGQEPFYKKVPGPPKIFYYLLLLSAKSQFALEQQTLNLANYLKDNPGLNLGDTAYTLQVGRARFPYRRTAVCATTAEAIEILANTTKIKSAFSEKNNRPVIFMFPGQGSQYVDMARNLYEDQPIFREEINRCFEILKPLSHYDFKEILYPSPGKNNSDQTDRTNIINQTDVTQPVIFIIEYALAKLLMAWGIKPYAMVGHSIGEYVAACLSGVLTLVDALKLVTARGALMQKMPRGAMLSIPLPENELAQLIKENNYRQDELSIAAVNSTALCVVSGPYEIINQLEEILKAKKYECSKLHTSHAFHSYMMEPILTEFEKIVSAIPLNKPQIPYLSNLTGNWIQEQETKSAGYWTSHLRSTVRFADNIKILLELDSPVFIEVGPGRTLSTFVQKYDGAISTSGRREEPLVVDLVRHPQKTVTDSYYLLNSIGQLWLYGIEPDWNAFYAHEKSQKPGRIPLPTYPFDRKRYWIEPLADNDSILAGQASTGQKEKIADWFYVPSWKQTIPPIESMDKPTGWLFFIDEPESKPGIGWALINRLRLKQDPAHITIVKAGQQFENNGPGLFTINPSCCDHYNTLLAELQEQGKDITNIIHLWMPGQNDDLAGSLERGVYSLLYLTKALHSHSFFDKLNLWVVTQGMHEIESTETGSPEKSVILGPCKVIPQEYPNIACRCVDIANSDHDELSETLAAEFSSAAFCPDTVIAYRGGNRWTQVYDTFKPVKPDPSNDGMDVPFRLRKNGVYLVIGGLGKIGFTMAQYLAQHLQAKLVLTTLPGYQPSSVQQLKELGADVIVVEADVFNEADMKRTISLAEERFGTINGIIHCAGIMDKNAFKLIADLDRENCESHFNAKIHGLYVLDRILKDKKPDFCMLTSSLSSVLGGLTLYAYSAAHSFMDAFAWKQSRILHKNWFTVNWDEWRIEDGTTENTGTGPIKKATCLNNTAINSAEGKEVLKHIYNINNKKIPQVIVSTRNLERRLRQWIMGMGTDANKNDQEKTGGISHTPGTSRYQRPQLQSNFEEPKDDAEQIVAEIWQELLGIDRVGVHDDFFQLGGHSLLATKLIARMREVFRIDLPLSILFDKPTIREIVNHIIDSWGDAEIVAEISRTYKEVFSN